MSPDIGPGTILEDTRILFFPKDEYLCLQGHESDQSARLVVASLVSICPANNSHLALMTHRVSGLGGMIPITIRCPEIDMRICFNVPVHDVLDLDKAYDTFCHRNIVDMVERSLSERG